MKLSKQLRVRSGRKFRLADVDPADTLSFVDKEAAQSTLQANIERLGDLQYRLYAEDRRSVLIVLQAIDAGGKDGTIRHVMTGLNPQGCRVTSFKVPSQEELDHDFLWRIHKAVPSKGEIGIFNRSHYEEVLVVRVHGLQPRSVWSRRYDQINRFETLLRENGIHIIKLFLHISKEEQKKRFEERLADPSKSWKFSPADLAERKLWDDYQAAFEDMLTKCSTEDAPWYVIPADKKWFRNLAVSQVIVDVMADMKMKFPKPSFDVRKMRIV